MKLRASTQSRKRRAFTIMEVMIAVAIFFMCIFAILNIVSQGLNNARALHRLDIDPLSALAELSLTNRLMEGPLPMEITATFADMYPGYEVSGEIYEVRTNGLFQIDFIVTGATDAGKPIITRHSALLFRPQSPPGGMSGIGGIRR